MKYPLAIIALAAAALNISGCARSAVDLPPGKYESKTSSTDAYDTTTEKQTSTTVGYDSYGNKKAVVHTKSSIDPPGLFNKSTTESDQVIEK
jgi:hypothetical protein